MDLFKLAWRNVWRNRRRSLVTIAAMSLALFVMILYSGLIEGYLVQMERSILDLEVGDLQIHAGDYRENPSLYTRIEEPARVQAPLEEAGFVSTGRLLGWGLAAADEASADKAADDKPAKKTAKKAAKKTAKKAAKKVAKKTAKKADDKSADE